MQVILTGSTGFIGSEVLAQAIAHRAITSLICITRRALPEAISSNPKVKVIIHTDFTSYPPEILSQLSGSEACIWSLGSPALKNMHLKDSKDVEIGYTLAGAEAFSNFLAPELKSKGKTFRFVYLSGAYANRDPNKKMWLFHDVLTMKGSVENGLLALQQMDDSNMDVTIVRPGGVIGKQRAVPGFLVAMARVIKVEELAAFMVNEAVAGKAGARTVENDVVRNEGRAVLKAEKRA